MVLILPFPFQICIRMEWKEHLVLDFVCFLTKSECEFLDRRQRWDLMHFYIHSPMQVLNKVYSPNVLGLVTFPKQLFPLFVITIIIIVKTGYHLLSTLYKVLYMLLCSSLTTTLWNIISILKVRILKFTEVTYLRP